MREDESNWFSKWSDELPSPEELTPLSQSLITPDLALAFNIPNPHQTLNHNSSPEFNSPELSGAAAGSDEPARTLKRPRLVWTPQLHKRFVDAVAHLGIKNAVPKTIMQLMSVDGLTRENVASHLQKYRLYLKRMQGISSGGNNGSSGMDSATDRLFASSPVPAQFLPFVPVSVPGAMHQHHGMQFRHFGANGQFEGPFVRQQVQGMGRNGSVLGPPFVEDLESGGAANGRKILTLFPTGDD